MEPEVIKLVNAAANAVGVLEGLALLERSFGNVETASFIEKQAQKLEEALDEVTRRM